MRRAFDQHYAEGSDVWTADAHMRGFPADIEARVGLSKAARVLDIGCGAGLDVAWFAARCALAVGLDLHAHEGWPDVRKARPNTRFVASDLLGFDAQGLELPGEAESVAHFDVVFDNGCFHHQHPEHERPWLRKVVSLLATGGCYVLSTFKNPAVRAQVDALGRLHRYYTDAELRGVLAAGGLRVEDEIEVWQPRRREFYRLTFARHAADRT
jgi:SAM-dependent methyltransferase